MSPYPNGLLTFPARSVQVPASEAAPLSGPAYEAVEQLSMPAVGSLPLKATETARLYQPFASAARAGWPPVTTGLVPS